jgi:hypothetical protein
MPSKLQRADLLGKMTGWLTKRVEIGADTLTAFLNEVFSQLPLGLQERGFILFGADLSATGRRAWNWVPQCNSCLLKANVPNVFVAATCVTVRSSALPPPWGRIRLLSNLCINTWTDFDYCRINDELRGGDEPSPPDSSLCELNG